jgi:membrane protease YdiL (CAAX protease family)
MPSPLDLALAFLILVPATLYETFVFFPRFRAAVAADPRARGAAYRRAVTLQWSLAVATLFLWVWEGRTWGALGLAAPGGVQLLASLALVAPFVWLVLRQARGVRRLTAPAAQALRPRFAEVEFILPHTRGERRWFMLLSTTAGVCEELVYRGFIMWVVASYTGVALAAVLQAALFGLGHAYQGRKGVLKTAAVGLVMALIVLCTGWLLPAMIVHALIDIGAGIVAYAVLRDDLPGMLVAA